MKGIKSIDIQNYLFLYVVLPLKDLEGLAVPNISSPLKDHRGTIWEVQVGEEPLPPVHPEEHLYRYEREQRQEERNRFLYLDDGRMSIPIAYFHNKYKWIKLYETPFKELGLTPIVGHMYDMCNRNTPFSKVILISDPEEFRTFKQDMGLETGRDVPF